MDTNFEAFLRETAEKAFEFGARGSRRQFKGRDYIFRIGVVNSINSDGTYEISVLTPGLAVDFVASHITAWGGTLTANQRVMLFYTPSSEIPFAVSCGSGGGTTISTDDLGIAANIFLYSE